MPFYSSSEREPKKLLEGFDARTFWGENMLVAVIEVAPNAIGPLHSHPHEQIGMVLEGELDFTIGEETRTLRPGDVTVIPGNTTHGLVAGDAPCKLIETFSPVREEYKY